MLNFKPLNINKFTVVFLLFVAVSCSKNQKETTTETKPSHTTKPHFTPTDTSWRKLTVRQKIGQIMLMLPDRKKELELGNGSLEGFFKRYPVTGFFMGWKLFDGV